MSDLQPRKHAKKDVAPRHIPQEVVPVPIADVRGLVRDAVGQSSLSNTVTSALSGWGFFEPHVRYTAVDETHTRIELDVVGTVRGAETLLFNQRRAEIDRFFVAIRDELDRRNRWLPHPPADGASIEGA